jgi:hypothetical protein
MTHENTHDTDTRSAEEVEQDIRRTRSRMDETLDALNDRLSPRSILNDLLTWFEKRNDSPSGGSRSSTGQVKRTTRTVTDYISEHPLPALMTGAGIVWMLLDARNDEERSEQYGGLAARGYSPAPSGRPYAPSGAIAVQPGTTEMSDFQSAEQSSSGPGITDQLKEKASRVGDAVSGAFGSVQERVSGLGDAVSGAASSARARVGETYQRGRTSGADLGRDLQGTYSRGEERFSRAVDDYPLAIGVGMLGLGLLAGLLLPNTRYEDKWMGEESDRLTDAAKEKAEDLMERGKEVAQQVASGAMDEAQKQGLSAEAGGDAFAAAAEKIGAVVERARSEAASAVEEKSLTPQQLGEEARESAAQVRSAAETGLQRRTT